MYYVIQIGQKYLVFFSIKNPIKRFNLSYICHTKWKPNRQYVLYVLELISFQFLLLNETDTGNRYVWYRKVILKYE